MPESQPNLRRFYIDGRWQAPVSQQLIDQTRERLTGEAARDAE